MNAFRQLLARVRRTGRVRPGVVTTQAMGRARLFRAWDVGDDTFIFEKDILRHLDERPSVLVVKKGDLRRRVPGFVLTVTTGNHSVAAFPLLDGRFWKLSNLPAAKRGETLVKAILCANLVGGKLETSQRDVPPHRLYEIDAWLCGTAGLGLGDVVMGDRNGAALEHYRRRGEEWRMKPLAWTEAEMKVALAASKRRIASSLTYYHSARGVHFLSFAEFKRLAALAPADPSTFLKGLRELVSVYEGQRVSFARLPKFRGHHEIELFGVGRGVGVARIVPELERLMEGVALGKVGAAALAAGAASAVALWESLLTRPEMADESSPAFIESLYMCVTGEVYVVEGEGQTPAFDDRRTALPGATFVDGRAVMHPGADARTEVLLSNLRRLMSKDETVTYANVYEIRDEAGVPVGKGPTRELVFKTNRRPLEVALVEKRLSSSRAGYASYVLARIGALRALGITLSPRYLMLRQRLAHGKRSVDFYIRDRCEGEPLLAIPQGYFCNADDASVEEKDVVLAIAQLLGDAAAQNMAMKKFDPQSMSPLFGVGKEIYEFEYDVVRQRVVPKTVRTCSIRGSFGWPDLSFTEENLVRLTNFYLAHYAHALKSFQARHAATMAELGARFMDGFAYRTHALAWQLAVMRDRFESFAPNLPKSYRFAQKWNFIMWSLERQERRLEQLRALFFRKVEIVENEDIRNHSEPVRVEPVPR